MRSYTKQSGLPRTQKDVVSDRLYEQLQVLVGDRSRSSQDMKAVRFKDLTPALQRITALETDTLDAASILADRILALEDKFDHVADELINTGSLVDQEPASTDTVLPVTFGSGSGDASTPVELKSNGTVVINQDGFYSFHLTAEAGRKGGSSGEAVIVLRSLFNGVQITAPITAIIDSPRIVIPLHQHFTRYLSSGSFLNYEMIRSSAGVNRGGLYTQSHPLNWGVSPSAGIRIVKHF